jgi:hypothetical protein
MIFAWPCDAERQGLHSRAERGNDQEIERCTRSVGAGLLAKASSQSICQRMTDRHCRSALAREGISSGTDALTDITHSRASALLQV